MEGKNMRYLPLLLLLGACASPPQRQYVWLHDSGGSRMQYERDYGACEAQALSSHPYGSVERGVSLFGACMRSRGWRLVER